MYLRPQDINVCSTLIYSGVEHLNQPTIYWCIISPKVLDEAVNEAVRRGTHKTKSDFIRGAVRKQLESLGFNLKLFGDNTAPAFLNAGVKKDHT